MIRIITGPIHSGKTTRMIGEYRKFGSGDGFASIKLMEGNEVRGFDIMRLSTGQRMPLARKEVYEGKKWRQCCKLGPYSFSADAIEHVDTVINKLVQIDGSVIFLDEIGLLELGGGCFDTSMRKIIDGGSDAVFTVRDSNLNAVIEKYGLEDAMIIETGERYV